jgi:glycosyltransferase involved in cell wall biosynthesis
MKIQLEQIDLLQPWPQIALRPGYHSVRVLAYVGNAPLGEVIARPARKGYVSHRNLRKRIAKKHALTLLRLLAREGLGAGPDALASFPREAKSSFLLTWSKWRQTTQWVEQNLLLPTGLPAPYRDWVVKGQASAHYPMPPVTVIVCTRDRHETLAGCIESLKQLDYPQYEIMIVDNSSDPAPTRAVVEQAGVTYTRVPGKGLSRARNAALQLAATRWVAFTDDDCRPEPNWLRELVRPLQDTNCASVTGLVLPAGLENAAEITFEIYGGLGRGYQDKTWDGWAVSKSRYRPVETWRMGAGANMLIDAPRVMELGGYDLDLGAGAAAPCSEDTDVWYQLLRNWHTIHYTPRAIVNHHHRSSPQELRKQIYAYAKGHAAYHWRCFWVYRDYRSLLHLMYHLPKWFKKNVKMGMGGKTKYPFSLVFLEVKGTMIGPFVYTMAKARRFGRSMMDWMRHPRRPRVMHPVAADPVPTAAHYDAVDAHKQSVRVA